VGREKKKWIGQVVKSKESLSPPAQKEKKGKKKRKKLVPFFKNYY
jgi:hypothetical protein